MAGGAPPARHEEARTGRCLDVLEVLDARVVGVCAEAVLFVVDGAEDVVSKCLDGGDAQDALEAELDRVGGEVAGLDGVGEGHPDDVTKGKHHTKTVGNKVDGGEDGRLHVQAIEHVDGLGKGDEEDRVGDPAKVAVLLGDEGEIEDDPTQQARTYLAPCFDIDLAEDGEVDTGVQFTADEPVVQHVPGVATGGEFTHPGVFGVFYAEGGDVDVDGENVGDEDVGCEQADEVVGDEGPNTEVCTFNNGPGAEDGQDEDGRGEG